MRLQEIRDRMLRLVKDNRLKDKYKEMWVISHNLSAPASTFPWPDTHAVATFCMLLEAMRKLIELEESILSEKNKLSI